MSFLKDIIGKVEGAVGNHQHQNPNNPQGQQQGGSWSQQGKTNFYLRSQE